MECYFDVEIHGQDAEMDEVYSSMAWCVIQISITVQVCNSFLAQVCGSQTQRLLCNTVALERWFSLGHDPKVIL